MSRRAKERRRGGFTLAEMLVFLVLATLVAAGLYQVILVQQRAYRRERATVARHDALRLASSVLAANLMEASGRGGDLGALGDNSLAVRSPVGFGIVCDVDSTNNALGLFDVMGRMSATLGDSLLVYHPGGWLVRGPVQLNPSGPALGCPYKSGPLVQLSVRVGGSVNGVPVGAPVRAFHRYVFRLEQDGGLWWLARDDGGDTDLLAGPFSADGSGLAFAYFDSTGAVTSDSSQVARVDLALVAENDRPLARRDTLSASVRPRNQ